MTSNAISTSTMPIAAPLLLLRHGETAWNTLGRYQGATDTPLSEAGTARGGDHAALVNALCNDGRLNAAHLSITTSPLQRAVGTALALQKALNRPIPVQTDKRLRELSFGRWEGLTSMEVKARFYEERKSRKADRYHFAPQGGDSMASRHSEVMEALATLAPNTLVVTHSGIIRLIAYAVNDDPGATAMPVPHKGGFLWDGRRLSHLVMEP